MYTHLLKNARLVADNQPHKKPKTMRNSLPNLAKNSNVWALNAGEGYLDGFTHIQGTNHPVAS